jgi:SAM-dependent methyltransferase
MSDIQNRFAPETFGALNAERYDAGLRGPEADPTAAVDVLAEVAAGGAALEFAIGTGRVALPLAARGVSVAGVEASPEMIVKLRAKPGGEAIPVTLGDMAEAGPVGEFDLVFLVFNTLFNLTTQDAQVRCFQNAARRLSPRGVFVLEAFTPDIAYLDRGTVRTMGVSFGAAWLEALAHDPVTQTVDYQRIRLSSDGVRLIPLAMRYAWPAEMDLMARVAGLELRERWADWDRSPFTAKSRKHISVYGWPRAGA